MKRRIAIKIVKGRAGSKMRPTRATTWRRATVRVSGEEMYEWFAKVIEEKAKARVERISELITK